MNTRSNSTALYNSMDSKNHLIGETIDWTPSSQVYLQANVNLVYATISTAYPRAGGTANDVVQNSDNNYSNGSLITGFVVDKATDAQLQFTWYHTNNFRPLVTSTLPLGSSVSEYTVTLGLKHKFTDRMIVHAKLGYFDSKNDSTGGKTSFHGPLAYLAFEHAL